MSNCTHGLIEMVSHGVCQCSYSIVKDEQVLVLVLPESKHQRIKNEAKVRHQLCTRFLLQGGKCTVRNRKIRRWMKQDEQTFVELKKKKESHTCMQLPVPSYCHPKCV